MDIGHVTLGFIEQQAHGHEARFHLHLPVMAGGGSGADLCRPEILLRVPIFPTFPLFLCTLIWRARGTPGDVL